MFMQHFIYLSGENCSVRLLFPSIEVSCPDTDETNDSHLPTSFVYEIIRLYIYLNRFKDTFLHNFRLIS